VRLVIEVETVADELVEIYFRRTVRAPITGGTPVTASVSAATGTPAAISATRWASTPITTTTRRTIFATAITLFFSHDPLRSYSV
jgi:hypothetical protein